MNWRFWKRKEKKMSPDEDPPVESEPVPDGEDFDVPQVEGEPDGD